MFFVNEIEYLNRDTVSFTEIILMSQDGDGLGGMAMSLVGWRWAWWDGGELGGVTMGLVGWRWAWWGGDGLGGTTMSLLGGGKWAWWDDNGIGWDGD